MKKNLLLLLLVLGLFLGCEKKGLDGKNSLTDYTAESAGANCSSGGYKIDVGIDLNDNGSLDSEEIQSTQYICNGDDGINGYNSLINISSEPVGEFCANGGIKIENGIDLNGNGLLDEDEIQNISYTCNGIDGINADTISILRIPIEVAFTWRNASIDWQSNLKDGFISNFNRDDYQGFREAYFIAQFDRSPDETSDSLWLRLFDYTNNLAINNSDIFSIIPNSVFESDPSKRIFKSINIFESLSNEDIQIGIQYRKQLNVVENRSISIHSAELRLIK
jgi:hypothetical protein